MKHKYLDLTFRESSLTLIIQVNAILEEYRSQGFILTLRQLYYQLVARDLIANDLRSYKRIVNTVGKGRLGGLIDWDMLTDRNRQTISPEHWIGPADILETAIDAFAIDKWSDQSEYMEVICEKDALSSVLEPLCLELDIRYTAAKGYNSLSNMREIGLRLKSMVYGYPLSKNCTIIYLGDHDPSGLDMIRDVQERLGMFAGADISVLHLALTWDQIQHYDPPENPAKTSDSRFRAYVAKHGASSWELDALEPQALTDLVRDAVMEQRDEGLWNAKERAQEAMRRELMDAADSMR